jgi:hypothetical protein
VASARRGQSGVRGRALGEVSRLATGGGTEEMGTIRSNEFFSGVVSKL